MTSSSAFMFRCHVATSTAAPLQSMCVMLSIRNLTARDLFDSAVAFRTCLTLPSSTACASSFTTIRHRPTRIATSPLAMRSQACFSCCTPVARICAARVLASCSIWSACMTASCHTSTIAPSSCFTMRAKACLSCWIQAARLMDTASWVQAARICASTAFAATFAC